MDTIELSMEPLAAVSGLKTRFDNAEQVRRSEENILRWMTYLPQDCINMMIRMGWDITT